MSNSSIHYNQFQTPRPTPPGGLFVDRPDTKGIAFIYLLPLLATVVAGMIWLLPVDLGLKAIYSVYWGGPWISAAFQAIQLHVRLKYVQYTVTTSYIEQRFSFLGLDIIRVPYEVINNIVVAQNPIQSWLGTYSLTVQVNNGRGITLRNIFDGEQKRDTIWNLVLSHQQSK